MSLVTFDSEAAFTAYLNLVIKKTKQAERERVLDWVHREFMSSSMTSEQLTGYTDRKLKK